jgi:hypothetical protein
MPHSLSRYDCLHTSVWANEQTITCVLRARDPHVQHKLDAEQFMAAAGAQKCGRPQENVTMHQCVGALIVQQQTMLLGQRSPTRTFYPNV